jgi:sarcosine oxidase subunit beta
MNLRIGTDLPKTTDLVIIGGGILGAASAFFAQRAGLSCVVLEKRPLLCTLTTPASTGAFRAQFDNPEEIDLVKESIDFFTHFKDITELDDCDFDLKQQGYLWLTTNEDRAARQRQLVENQRRWGLDDVELISGEEARKRYPYLSHEVISARFRAADGWLEPRKLTMAWVRASRARYCVQTEVTGFEMHGSTITAVKTKRGDVSCQHALVAAGPFSGEVAALAGLSLPLVTRIRQKLVMPDVPEIPGNVPMTIDEDTGAHWRPAMRGAYVLLTQHNQADTPPMEDVPISASFFFDLLNPNSTTATARIAPFWKRVWERNTDLWYLMAGQYTYTPDHKPLLGRSAVSNLWLNCGYSGHGIMGSAAGSRIVIDELTGKLKPSDNPFSPGRGMQQKEFDVL